MLPSANVLCVRLGHLVVCSMWKRRMQVLQRTMTSQTMCWCLAYSPVAVHDGAKELLNKFLGVVTRHSISKPASNGKSSDERISCPLRLKQGNHRSCLDLNTATQWICAGFLPMALREERYSTMELRSKLHIAFRFLGSSKKYGS